MQRIGKYTRKIKRIAELKKKEQDVGLTFDEETELERLLDYVEMMGDKELEE